ncbi:acetate--CoA ligase family protein [Acidiferrimicrobium sp. IK]|uniref:acetate--CoA ligase family protein n=1 Tax=Acidiferrimicrobium sp. IK TaxID=2871700 RepID=UPI0021CB8A91|nr:acetate--CoA ligase family protein [Acidiferrimicrobium sp. IK]MCU4183474.1 acetate--CoA ligase family protein [Acidiferrimicrobium sp. IK]
MSIAADDGPTSLGRLLSPRSVALVGASEGRTMSDVAVSHLQNAGVDLHLVNARSATAYGLATVPSLSAIGTPVDAVLTLIGAKATADVVDEAGALGCAGLVLVASGFAEVGPDGVGLQGRIVDACHRYGMAAVGPNCTGFANISEGVSLFTGMPVALRPGPLSIVSQSGYLMRAAMVAARERNLGVRLAVSSGNEAVTGLADYIDFLAADPETTVICLVLETIRDREGFFAAVGRARAAGKPIIALKLGHSDRGRDIMQSHTGAIATEAWVYEVGLRQAGVVLAEDLEGLLDRAQLLVQLPRERWRVTRNVALIASSGGVAALASDIVTSEGVDLPALDDLRERVRQTIPTAPYANPLDLTGFAVEPPSVVEDLVEIFTASDDVDALVVGWWTGDEDARRAEMFLEPLRNVAGRTDTPLIITTVEESRIGTWTTDAAQGLVACTRGLRGTARALAAMAEHVGFRGGPLGTPLLRDPLPRPATVNSAAGPIVGFADSLRLLAEAGVPVAAPIIADGPGGLADADLSGLGDAAVVKLADVPHRTEMGAVRVGVPSADLLAVAEDLDAIARREGVPPTLAIQPLVTGRGEAFIGGRNRTDLGAIIVVGLGGVLVELTGRPIGRLLPATTEDIEAMLDELGAGTVFAGLRGQEAWDRKALAAAVAGVAELMTRAPWLESIDVNPLICDERGCTAVDALLVMTPET